MSKDYTPTTPDVRDSWRSGRLWAIGSNIASEAEFDRWLAGVKSEAWQEAADCAPEYMPHNPYRADRLDPS